MTDDYQAPSPSETRAQILAELVTTATDLFAKKPNVRSLMLAVAQYWSDEADDATHSYLVASERDTPLWPHDCAEYSDYDREHAVAGEICEHCDGDLGYLENWDDNGEAIAGFGAYCHEHGSQEEPMTENYLPYAVVRRTDDGIVTEIVGALLRPWDEMHENPHGVIEALPLDARASELMAESAHSNDVRRVLSDYLLEQNDPRGEYISLALADYLDDGSLARRDELLAKHLWQWIAPLATVIPVGGARFERGLFTHAEVWAPTEDLAASARGAAAWSTVHSLRYTGDGCCVLHPSMRALRAVEIARLQTLETLATGEWPIERLHAVIDNDFGVRALAATHALPKLRDLELAIAAGLRDEALDRLRTAPWRSQLSRLTILGPFEEVHSKLTTEIVPQLAIAEIGHGDRPAGWRFTFDRTETEPRLLVSLAGFSDTSNRTKLGEQLEQLVDVRTVLVRSPRWQPTEDDVTVLSRSGRGITLS